MKFRAFLLSVILAAGVSMPTLASAQTDPKQTPPTDQSQTQPTTQRSQPVQPRVSQPIRISQLTNLRKTSSTPAARMTLTL